MVICAGPPRPAEYTAHAGEASESEATCSSAHASNSAYSSSCGCSGLWAISSPTTADVCACESWLMNTRARHSSSEVTGAPWVSSAALSQNGSFGHLATPSCVPCYTISCTLVLAQSLAAPSCRPCSNAHSCMSRAVVSRWISSQRWRGELRKATTLVSHDHGFGCFDGQVVDAERSYGVWRQSFGTGSVRRIGIALKAAGTCPYVCLQAWRQRVLRCRSSLVYRREVRQGCHRAQQTQLQRLIWDCLHTISLSDVVLFYSRGREARHWLASILQFVSSKQTCVLARHSCGPAGSLLTCQTFVHTALAACLEFTLMYSRSSDGENPKPRIVQVIGFGESASQPLLDADDCVSVWNTLGHNGQGREYRGSNGVLTAFGGKSVSADPRTASCSHSTSRLSGDVSAFVPHDSAGTGTGDGDSTVLNGDSSDGVAEQCSASYNNICEAAVLSSDGSTSVPRSLEGSYVDLAPVPCDVMPAITTHSVCREDICAALAASADICSVFTDPTGDSGAGKEARPGVDCDGVGGGIAGVSISMASPVETAASDANSSRPNEEDSPAVLNSSSEIHAAPTALSRCMVNPTCLSNNGDAGIQHAAAGSCHDMATDDHGSRITLTAATEPSAAGAPPSTSVAKSPSARSSGARYCNRQCSHCGMLGHLLDRCWKLHPQLRRKTSPVEAASTAPASGEQSSAAQTPTKRRGGDNTHRHAGAHLRATAGSKSSAGASSHTASKEERALRKQVARLKQDAAALRERLAGLESRVKKSAVAAEVRCCCRCTCGILLQWAAVNSLPRCASRDCGALSAAAGRCHRFNVKSGFAQQYACGQAQWRDNTSTRQQWQQQHSHCVWWSQTQHHQL
ncbi:hypothetical protein JKP88DRAFT_245057 [Tribonema minus]|uniref:Uncharacterized protein n=1 Tax=Tribonema minus TaxID=303371 RepID=A0A835YXS5_9STRA|nr:hypothetical protein JKP88DRAFT_245057 [Tribonema minus]